MGLLLALGNTRLANGNFDERSAVIQRRAKGREPRLEEGVFDQVGQQTEAEKHGTASSQLVTHSPSM